MSTKHFNRPDASTIVSGEVGLTNRDKFRVRSATIPKLPISSAQADSENNYIIDGMNELYDTAIAGILPDNSVTLAKLDGLTAGSMYYMDGSGDPAELGVGTNDDVLTVVAGAPVWQAPQSILPAGIIMPYGGTTAPTGFIICDGSDVSRATYADLFAAITTTFGIGDGSTTFGLPDMRGVSPVGKDNMGGVSANKVTDAQADILGGELGTEEETLDITQMPAHEHTLAAVTDHNPALGGANTSPESLAGGTATTSTVGGGLPHNNMQPSIFLNYIIKT